MKRSPLAESAKLAARARMHEILEAAVREHGGDLGLVAEDPRVGCGPKNLHHFARQARLDIKTLAATCRREALGERQPKPEGGEETLKGDR